jgi:1-acyl-sn-glycerol-3-phosphate acyltransferase
MAEFLRATGQLLKDGNFVLVYPEQSMWWNYRKPKPLQPGAFSIAAKNGVPVLPVFITMQDSDVMGGDGFPIQEYTIHVGDPIYPDKDKTNAENAALMQKANAECWKEIYEGFYSMSLEYTTK